jgi:putative hemolysin
LAGLRPGAAESKRACPLRLDLGPIIAKLTARNSMDSAATPALADPAPKHIVDILIEERAPHLSGGAFWPLLRPILYSVLNYRKARSMADAIGPMGGRAALDYVSKLLSVKLQIKGAERMPRSGGFLLIANHPTGITDGVAVYDAVRPIRPDAMFYANSDAHRVCPRFDENLIPVEWVIGKRTRERTRLTLKMTEKAIADGRPIVIFPAGRLARRRNGVLVDPEWMPTATSLARKYNVPILPCHVAGPEAVWFHTFARFSSELRDITLFHELLNKHGKTYHLSFGPLIPAAHAVGDSVSVTRRIKHYVERVLGADPDAVFDPAGPECPWRDPAKPATSPPLISR